MTSRRKIVISVLTVAVLLAGAAGFVLGRYYIDNKKPNFSEKYVLYVRPDMTVGEVLDSLQTRAGTIRPKSVERAFAEMETADRMKPGRYVVDSTCTSIYGARMLVFGWQTPQNMTGRQKQEKHGPIRWEKAVQRMCTVLPRQCVVPEYFILRQREATAT
jgi:cell division protein YceG involved in septum cleavage